MATVTLKGLATLTGEDADGDEREHDLAVYYDGAKGYDMHPYGSTYARQDWLEVYDAKEFELDDEPVTLQYLNNVFGEDTVKAAITNAEQNAEEDE